MASLTLPRHRNDGDWRAYFQSQLAKLQRELPEGADSFAPHRPTSHIVTLANQVANSLKRDDLPLPLIIAGSDGSLQIKWRKNRELSFFVSPEAVEFLRVDPKNGMEEGSVKNPAHASELIDWLLAS